MQSLDTCICLFIITPLSIFWWSGTWKLVTSYSSEIWCGNSVSCDLNSALLCLLIGGLVCVTGHIILPTVIWRTFIPDSKGSAIIVRLFIYIYSLGYINIWRGLWDTTSALAKSIDMSHQWVVAYIIFGIAYLGFVCLRCTSYSIGVPFAVSVDKTSEFFEMSLCFGSQVSTYFWCTNAQK